jgi:predicted lysophospholipase L1 biosynthesis ABC-type transport system permease subunit
MTAGIGVAWYRTRCQFRRRLGGYLVTVVLLGLVGGLALGSIAAARRTDSSFPRYLARSNASDVTVSTGGGDNNATSAYSSVLMKKIARLPDVRHVEASAFLLVAPLEPDGAPDLKAIASVDPVASIDGLFFNQDGVAVLDGRLANPSKANEVMVDPNTARLLDVHVGQTMEVGGYSGEQTLSPRFGTPRVPPVVRVKAKIVGIVDLADQVVQDDVDRSSDFVILTPAFGRKALNIVGGETYGVQLKRGASDVTNFTQEFPRLVPAGSFFQFHVTSSVESKVQRAIKPEAIALLIFGVIAAVAALLIGLQAVSRQLRARDDELQVLRALGASALSVMLDSFVGVFIAIVLGAAAAIGVAIALSPLAPIGAVHLIDPSPGVNVDWTVLGLPVACSISRSGGTRYCLSCRTAPRSRPTISTALQARPACRVIWALDPRSRRHPFRR